MAKEVMVKIKLQIPSGQATPAPPVGPALGQHGVSPGEFVNRFNQATKDGGGIIVPVEVTVYKDRSFDFIIKSPPAAVLLKRAAGIAKGSGICNREKVGKVNRALIKEIAQTKKKDLNAYTLEAATKIIEGTAKSMGIEIIE